VNVLDGNAIGGQLLEVFGRELTDATCVCATCAARAQVAELVVYVRGPGTVVRCRSCSNVVIVLVSIRGITCVDLGGLATLDPLA